MKKLILATCLVLSTLAHSGEIILSDTVYSNGETFAQGDFQINESLGRAWVQLTFYPADPEAISIFSERKRVEGLSFDATSQEVYLETETGRIVCAYQKTGLFRVKTIRPTGNCNFKKSFYKVTRDNGYEIETITKQKITLHY